MTRAHHYANAANGANDTTAALLRCLRRVRLELIWLGFLLSVFYIQMTPTHGNVLRVDPTQEQIR